MKVKELIRLIEIDEECEVCVRVNEDALGPMPTVAIESVFLGFDWDKGKVILNPSIELKKIEVKNGNF